MLVVPDPRRAPGNRALTRAKRDSRRRALEPGKSKRGPLNHQTMCGICSVLRDKFFMRNTEDKAVHGSSRDSPGTFRAGAERLPVPYGGQVSILHRLPRSTCLLPCLVGKSSALARFILERWGHMRWWSDGAFGNKGRLEGGQYRAGRRAPPLLHRQPEGLSDAGGQVCQPRFFRIF